MHARYVLRIVIQYEMCSLNQIFASGFFLLPRQHNIYNDTYIYYIWIYYSWIKEQKKNNADRLENEELWELLMNDGMLWFWPVHAHRDLDAIFRGLRRNELSFVQIEIASETFASQNHVVLAPPFHPGYHESASARVRICALLCAYANLCLFVHLHLYIVCIFTFTCTLL